MTLTALDLTLLATDTLETNQLNNLNFQGCLLPNKIQASLGQTLLLFAKPVDFSGNHQELAVACVEALFQDVENQPKPYLIAEYQILGSPIFEFDNAQAKMQIVGIKLLVEYRAVETASIKAKPASAG